MGYTMSPNATVGLVDFLIYQYVAVFIFSTRFVDNKNNIENHQPYLSTSLTYFNRAESGLDINQLLLLGTIPDEKYVSLGRPEVCKHQPCPAALI